MPPRYAYWTIIAGGLPTAFRATEREELEPTFQRLREKHPDAQMKWFARGKLWDTPEDSRARRDERGDERGDAGARKREWRPGGEHRDPRQPYKDAKKARNQRWREEKFEKRQRFSDRDDAPREKPHGDKLQPRGRAHGDRAERPAAPKGSQWQREGRPRAPKGGGFERKPYEARDRKPFGDRERKSFGDRKPWRPTSPGGDDHRLPREKPHGDKLQARKRWDGERDERPRAPQGSQWQRDSGARAPKGARAFERKPFESRDRPPSGDRRSWPSSSGGRDDRRPPREKPHGDKLQARKRWDDRDDRPRAPRGPASEHRPSESRERKPFGDRRPFGRPPREKPHGDKLQPRAKWDEKREQRDRPRDGGRHGGGAGDRTFSSKRRDDWNNEWKPRPASSERPPFPGRDRERGGGTEEPSAPPRPRGPNREPRPGEDPEPGPPPRPSEPAVPPPGPPERGRLNKNPRRRDR